MKNMLYKTGSSSLPRTTTVFMLTILFTASDFALFTKTRVGQVPHYRNFTSVFIKVYTNIMSLLAFGTNTTPKHEVKEKRESMQVKTFSMTFTIVEPSVYTLLTLLPRPVLPSIVAIMKTATSINSIYLLVIPRLFKNDTIYEQLKQRFPIKGTAASSDPLVRLPHTHAAPSFLSIISFDMPLEAGIFMTLCR